jgi:hypothetical protein
MWLLSERSRALFLDAFDGARQASAGGRASQLAQGVEGTLNPIPLGFVLLWGPSLLLGTVTCALMLSAAWTRGDLARALSQPDQSTTATVGLALRSAIARLLQVAR